MVGFFGKRGDFPSGILHKGKPYRLFSFSFLFCVKVNLSNLISQIENYSGIVNAPFYNLCITLVITRNETMSSFAK